MNYDLVSAEGFNQSQPGQGGRQKCSLHKHSAPDGHSSQSVKLTISRSDGSMQSSHSDCFSPKTTCRKCMHDDKAEMRVVAS